MRMRRSVAVIGGGVAALLAAAGIAYATIPDGGAVYTACMLKNVGTIRLIDPSGPSGSLLSRCSALETQIQWNQKGQKGDTGPAGANGVSPTVAQLPAGDSRCPAGGAAITDANGSTAYVCNGQNGQPGQNGKDGKDFSGTFTSGQFSLTVAADGVQITGPGAQISLDSTGLVTIKGDQLTQTVANDETVTVGHDRTVTVGHDELVHVAHDRTQTVDNNETIAIHGNRTQTVDKGEAITIHGNRTETVDLDQNVTIGGSRTENVSKDENISIGRSRTENVGSDENITIGGSRTETVTNDESLTVGGSRSQNVTKDDTLTVKGDRTETVGGTLGLRAAVDLKLDATFLGLNAGATCKPVARVGDLVDSVSILTGSRDICVD